MNAIPLAKPMYKRFNSYSSWKAGVRAAHNRLTDSSVVFEGDKDICQAFAIINGKRFWRGEWEGTYGDVMQLV